MLRLASARATALVDPVHGGRLASLRIDGFEVLVTGDASSHPMMWGSFPMVPWAGRVRHGRFRFGGADRVLPINLAPHSIHGTGYTARWDVGPGDELTHAFDGAVWPFRGHAVQRFELDETGLTCHLAVHAEGAPMPAMAGWHPWFRKPVELSFEAARMYRRDHEGMPDGSLVDVPTGPWDDCFDGVAVPPTLRWPDGPTLTVTSSCDHWVVYDQPADALCVEPQTGPPDEFNLRADDCTTATPGEPLRAWMRLSWR